MKPIVSVFAFVYINSPVKGHADPEKQYMMRYTHRFSMSRLVVSSVLLNSIQLKLGRPMGTQRFLQLIYSQRYSRETPVSGCI